MTDIAEIIIEYIGGNCPVQSEGTINGRPFYFRARGEHWSLEIGKPETPDISSEMWEPEWEHAEWFGSWPDAGWMTPEQAEGFLRQAAARYIEGKPGAKLEDFPERLASRARRLRGMLSMEDPK